MNNFSNPSSSPSQYLNQSSKLNALTTGNINRPPTITAPLLLGLFLGEISTARHAEILVRPIAVVVPAVGVRGQFRVNFGVAGHTLEVGRARLLGGWGGGGGCIGGGDGFFVGRVDVGVGVSVVGFVGGSEEGIGAFLRSGDRVRRRGWVEGGSGVAAARSGGFGWGGNAESDT